jgi:nicotinamidase-related amidase
MMQKVLVMAVYNKTTLVIIDVQLGMFLYERFPVYKENELLDNICALIEKARVAKIPIVYVQHTSGDGEALGRGKPGWILHPMITPPKGGTIVEKTTPDSFYDTELNDVLKSMGVNKLVMCGLQTEFCIDTTCRRAFSLGYETILVGDAHSTYDNGVLSAELHPFRVSILGGRGDI